MFIAIEGLDGAGTTTQTERLVAWLRSEGHEVVSTREPSDGPIGVQIRQVLRKRIVLPDGDRLSPDTIALLFAADRVDHVISEIEPALDRGAWVVTDRYVHSSIAYQGSECDASWVHQINRHARAADLVVFVDVPVEICLQRVGSRGRTVEIYEKEATLREVAAAYEEAFRLRPERVVRVDGTASPEQVHDAIRAIVADR